jgi:hypothetical protein
MEEASGKYFVGHAGGWRLEAGGHLAHTKPEIHTLDEHLVVEDEIIGVLEQGQRLQHTAAERTIAVPPRIRDPSTTS